MKLICPADQLSKALAISLRTVGTRAGIPALAGVLLEVDENELKLTTTDLELTTEVRLPVSGDPDRVVVPAKYLADIVRNAPTDEVEIVREDGGVRIDAGRARYALRTLPADDFPKPSDIGEVQKFTVASAELAGALGRVITAASRDEARPVLTGVLFESQDGTINTVATDSFRLAVAVMTAAAPAGLRLLVPARAISEVLRIATSETVEIEAGATQAVFTCGNVTVRSRLIEGEFPAFRQLFPSTQPNTVLVDKAKFIERVKAVSVIALETTPIHCEFEPDRIRITCNAPGVGEATEEVDAQLTGEPMKLAFNATYLEAGLTGVAEDTARIELTEPQRPVIVRGESDSYKYLLMPIRVS